MYGTKGLNTAATSTAVEIEDEDEVKDDDHSNNARSEGPRVLPQSHAPWY